MWVPPEDKDPVVMHAPTRKSMALFGAVSIRSGKLVHMTAPVFNAATFGEFLTKLIRRKARNKKMLIILDNARYHHAVMIHPWLKKYRKSIGLLFLPPYSPDLNPIERVWKLTRKLCTHNQYFPHLDLLIEKVSSQMNRWGRRNDELHKLCCIT
jgi:transposase